MSADVTSHVVYCRGCQNAWVDVYESVAHASAEPPERGPWQDCRCECSDDTDAHYEDWVTDPDPADIPPGAWPGAGQSDD